MKLSLLFLFFFSFFTLVFSQSIQNVTFRQTDDDKIVITYDILGGEGQTFEVTLLVSPDGGQNYTIVPRTLSGDVGEKVSGGRGKMIIWDVLSDIRRLEGQTYVFKVQAKTKSGATIAGIEMVFIPGGTFQMGDTFGDGFSDEKPVHTVTVSDFYLGKYEVTQKQWMEIMGSNPSYFKGDNRPVETVSWNNVQEFIRRLNARSGGNYRLPTEAEWEYAARGGNKSKGYKYSGSNEVGAVAWYDGNSGSQTHPAGTKLPNELGLYDMSGNVWEWCQDWYGGYPYGSQINPKGPSSGQYRVLRGGSWFNDGRDVRASNRDRSGPEVRSLSDGFRLAR